MMVGRMQVSLRLRERDKMINLVLKNQELNDIRNLYDTYPSQVCVDATLHIRIHLHLVTWYT